MLGDPVVSELHAKNLCNTVSYRKPSSVGLIWTIGDWLNIISMTEATVFFITGVRWLLFIRTKWFRLELSSLFSRH